MLEEQAGVELPSPGLRRPQRRARAPLSEESAASVRDAAIAIMCHELQYVPVVEDGTLVGVLAVRGLDRP